MDTSSLRIIGLRGLLRSALVAATLCASLLAPAREAQPLSADPALEARVLAIADELRCLVCQNETLAASHADLAVDLRKQIRQQLSQGRTDVQIRDFMVQRYGDFVLYRPPLKATTVLLWAGPFLLLAAGIASLAATIRRRKRASELAPLSAADTSRARRLLDPGAETK